MNHSSGLRASAHWVCLAFGALPHHHVRFRTKLLSAMLAGLSVVRVATAASTCPFDTGGSDAINDGVVLTRMRWASRARRWSPALATRALTRCR